MAQHRGLDCMARGLRHWGCDGSFGLGSFARGKRTEIGLGSIGRAEGKILGKVLTRKRNHKQVFSCCLIAKYIQGTELYASFV